MQGIIVFARMSSSRLPGKSLADINGRSLIGRVLDRSKAVGFDGPVILATSDRSDDDCLAQVAEAERVELYRGSLDDVAGRALSAARAFGLNAFARVCGDRPFFDPAIVCDLGRVLREEEVDLATNAQIKTFPPGLTAEVVRTEALERALTNTTDPEDREHVTRFMYANPNKFRIRNVIAQRQFDDCISLVIDTPDDLARARHIAAGLGALDGPDAPVSRVAELAIEWHDQFTGRGKD